MRSVVEFDTAIGTSNLGDEIILQCLEEELDFLLKDSFIMRFGTHVKNFELSRYLFGSQKLDFAYEADFKLVMGTNMLSRDIKKTQAQWPVKKLDSYIYDNCILAGVGTTLGDGKTTNYSRKIYQRILRKDFYHSVRDEASKKMLEEMGFLALNTGCPTLWKLTPEFCKQIPTKKADRVIFSLSGYKAQANRAKDALLIQILKENYEELIFWAQTSRDELYLDTFEGVEDIPRIYSLEKYAEVLDEGNIDYVGTRLHGGVFAMQHKVRSIVISIDHRARGFHETNHIVICERDEIEEKLVDMIHSEFATEVVLQQEEIDQFKAQFTKSYPKEKRKRHDDMIWIKLVRFPRNGAKKLLRMKRNLGKKLKKLPKVLKKDLRNVKFKINRVFGRMGGKRADIVPGKVLFFPFQGAYTCNLKYIADEIVRRKLPWEQVWVTLKNTENVKDEFPEHVKLVKFNSAEYYRELGEAQIWVDNAFNFAKGRSQKKEGQYYLETMHGSLGIKKIGPDVVHDEERNARGFLCGELTDYAISNSSFESMVYETSFWKKENIVELGHARNDIFFIDENRQKEITEKVYEYFGLEPGTHMALFAPTFENEDDAENAAEKEIIDFDVLHQALTKRFGGNWVILNRSHHSTIKKLGKKNVLVRNRNVKDANDYPDIQELMIAIEVGITDYSSWIYDYVLTRKAGFLYTPDLDQYNHNRGFYYPIEETPFAIAKSNAQLAKVIADFEEETFAREVERFLNDRGCIDDGHASERIVDLMEQIVNGSEKGPRA